MRKVMLSRKQGRILMDNIGEISYYLFEGFSMDLDDVKPKRNKLGWIKYYKVYVDTTQPQIDVVNAFRWFGLIPFKK